MNRLREAIEKYPSNWENCVMWVEDIVSPSVNIMAEMSNDDANNFVNLCQIFSSHVPKFDGGNPSLIEPVANLSQNIFGLIEKEVAVMSHPSILTSRQRSEAEAVSILTKYIKQFKGSLDIYLFGSSHYGIKKSNTNLNLLVNTRMFADFIKSSLLDCDK